MKDHESEVEKLKKELVRETALTDVVQRDVDKSQ